MKSLLLLSLLICSARCFRFVVNDNWYHTEDIQYELLQLPDTYIIDCWDPDVQCVAQNASILTALRVDTEKWLTDHYGEIRVTDGMACFTDFWGPAISAELSCETMKNGGPWSPIMYNARRCVVRFRSPLPDSVIMASSTAAFFLLSYVSLLIPLATIKHKVIKGDAYRFVYRNPALRTTIKYQITLLLLLWLYAGIKLWEKVYPVKACHSRRPEDHTLFIFLCYVAVAVAFCAFVVLAIFSLSVRRVSKVCRPNHGLHARSVSI